MATRNDFDDEDNDGDFERPFEQHDGNNNGFFGPPSDEPSGPGSVLAAFEVPEEREADDEQEPLHFECVEQGWASKTGVLDHALWDDDAGRAPLSVIELPTRPQWLAGGAPGSIAWYQIRYEPSSPSMAEGRIYNNLFSQGTPIRIAEAAPANELVKQLQLGDFADFLELRSDLALHEAEHLLSHHLAKRKRSSGVAVYDVGQGNWQAVLDPTNGRPFVYVDVGGGVLYNRRTFPKDFQMRRSDAAPVILSHWDWDHWSSARRFNVLLDVPWVAPALSSKPIQTAFAMQLRKRGQLHVLPKGWAGSLVAGCIRMERCTGTSENDRGLAVTVYSRTKNGRSCLLPGDAAYRHIPSVATVGEKFNALCMSHHGGRLHSTHYPLPDGRVVAANSSGPGNTYKHPLFKTLVEHKSRGWPMPAQTGISGSRPCHVYMPWGKKPQMFHGSCEFTGSSISL